MVKNTRVGRRMVKDPTPEQIRSRAAAIRQGWTKRERIRRACWTPPPWLPPLLDIPEIQVVAPEETSV